MVIVIKCRIVKLFVVVSSAVKNMHGDTGQYSIVPRSGLSNQNSINVFALWEKQKTLCSLSATRITFGLKDRAYICMAKCRTFLTKYSDRKVKA